MRMSLKKWEWALKNGNLLQNENKPNKWEFSFEHLQIRMTLKMRMYKKLYIEITFDPRYWGWSFISSWNFSENPNQRPAATIVNNTEKKCNTPYRRNSLINIGYVNPPASIIKQFNSKKSAKIIRRDAYTARSWPRQKK